MGMSALPQRLPLPAFLPADCICTVSEELSDIRMLLNQFNTDYGSLKESVAALENAWPALGPTGNTAVTDSDPRQNSSTGSNQRQTRPLPDITLEVHRALSDKARRKQDIVVTGLPEADDSNPSDEMAFIHLCEEHLSIKPALKPNGC